MHHRHRPRPRPTQQSNKRQNLHTPHHLLGLSVYDLTPDPRSSNRHDNPIFNPLSLLPWRPVPSTIRHTLHSIASSRRPDYLYPKQFVQSQFKEPTRHSGGRSSTSLASIFHYNVQVEIRPSSCYVLLSTKQCSVFRDKSGRVTVFIIKYFYLFDCFWRYSTI
ncbi:uncharacterized protein BO80DRAFT_245799 [Aspergillus ibericus CBS 121593]|uniref:Uncharacterized protein n=1 Tax=Aspergillus ibericus CBS 121593 TaxID=1448316 RepID=A0A395GKY0_9EURO|nr:hypothetical protein BO80DRAFT_245799 [Aspergillus ibericus CBS 121593]RAK95992.1 hypothetical protein BO80DRAFT_245799 [Aspergillus ibericus CBS 121593]